MYNNDNNMKEEKAKDIIKNINSSYYERELEKLNQRIDNLKNGLPEYHGIHSHGNSEKLTKKEAEKRIKTLQIQGSSLIKEYKTMNDVVINKDIASSKIEDLAEKDALISELKYMLTSRKNLNFENSEKYINRYNILGVDSRKPLDKENRKIEKDMGKLLGKNSRLYTLKSGHGVTIKDLFSLSKYNIDSVFASLYREEEERYSRKYKFSDVFSKEVEDALKQSEMTRYEESALEISKKINSYLSNSNSIGYGVSDLGEIKKKYDEVIAISKEIEYLNALEKVFSNTSIKDSKICQSLMPIASELEEQLKKTLEKADKEYQKCEFKEYVDIYALLQSKIARMKKLDEEMELHKDNQRYLKELENEYYTLLNDIEKILEENPNLNFNVYEEIGIKKGKKVVSNELEQKKEKEEFVYDNLKQQIKNEENLSNEIKKEERVTSQGNPIIENLQETRSFYYQKYYAEKFKQSELGLIPFSEYLEQVAPELIELIEIEKQSEEIARLLYDEYCNMSDQMITIAGFEAFIERKRKNGDIYIPENIDIPIEEEIKFRNNFEEMDKGPQR